MIRSFKSRETEKIFSRQKADSVPEDVQRTALRELRSLDRSLIAREDWLKAADHVPSGDAGRYAIALDEHWRLLFQWRDGHAYEVEIENGKGPLP